MLQVVGEPPVDTPVRRVAGGPHDGGAVWGFAEYLGAGSPGVNDQQVAALHGVDVQQVAVGLLGVPGQ